ncbi:MAG: nucleotidyltransferase domain-containing protein, partial [Ktedonobacterales bacterium]
VQPIQATPDWFCDWFGRAFLHARVEWVGGVDARADGPEISDFGPTAASRRQTVRWRGHSVHVPPLDLQLLVSQRRGLSDRVAQIQKLMESGG